MLDTRAARQAGGVFLIEALLAIVLFSIGVAGLLGIMSQALRDSGNAQWRSEASYLASATLSRMWTEAPSALDERYAAPDAPGYRALLAAAMRLPGVSATENAPSISIDAADDGTRRIVVTVAWQSPIERSVHHASAAGVLP